MEDRSAERTSSSPWYRLFSECKFRIDAQWRTVGSERGRVGGKWELVENARRVQRTTHALEPSNLQDRAPASAEGIAEDFDALFQVALARSVEFESLPYFDDAH
jgi:hypothetical protein